MHEVEDARRAIDWAQRQSYPSLPSDNADDIAAFDRPRTFWQISDTRKAERCPKPESSRLWKALHLTICRQFWVATGILGAGCKSTRNDH
jgi:hypothetical protein